MFPKESIMRVIVQKYDRVFCYFQVEKKTITSFNRKHGKNSYENSAAYLKVYEKGNEGVFYESQRIAIDTFTDNWYIDLGKDNTELYIIYGREFEDNAFEELIKSNIVITPRHYISGDNNVEYADIKFDKYKKTKTTTRHDKKGYVSIVLHSHLPYVRHADRDEAIEERWFFEAMLDCYLPLIDSYDKMIKDGVYFRITMSITPPLMNMFEDEYMNKKFQEYLENTIELCKIEIERTIEDEAKNKLAIFYYERFNRLKKLYTEYDNRVMNAFRKFDNLGNLEIITCAATHGLLPLLACNIDTVRAQIKLGVEYYKEIVGHSPNGIWLPECAFSYDIMDILKENKLKYFIVEDDGINFASPKPNYGTAAPIIMPNGVAVFGRDKRSGGQVWSSFDGYPGDVDYREFYKDIGYEISEKEVKKYINPAGVRVDSGIKYYRITGKTENKEIYVREWAESKVRNQAKHFTDSRVEDIDKASFGMKDKKPIILSPYDAELFGHWWFEGPDFIEDFMRKSTDDYVNYDLITPSEYLEKNKSCQISTPSPSTWGENTDYTVWLNTKTDWIYKKVHDAEKIMIDLANKSKRPKLIVKKALNQMGRELVLAESSDWAFIIKNDSSVTYAIDRINEHLGKFYILADQIENNNINEDELEKMEWADNIFPNMDFRYYRSKS